MADLPNPLQTIQQPESTVPQSAEPAYFVMPAEYRHGALGKKMVQPRVEPPKVLTVTPPPPVKPPVVPAVAAPKKARLSRSSKIILVAGVILVVGLAVGGYVVLNALKAPVAAVPEKPVATVRPAPAVEPTKPVETTKPPVVTEPPVTESPFPSASTPGTDSDSDGLTDLEEKLIYGTNPKLPDTDSDGFLDGNEVFHRYNPGGTAPGTLLESGLVKQEDAADYRMLFPSVWSVSGGTYTATTGEMVVVEVADLGGKTFDQWFAAQNFAKDFTVSKTKNGYVEHVEDDGLMELVETGDGHVVSLRYDTHIKTTIDYLQTFKMMVNSLEWLSFARN